MGLKAATWGRSGRELFPEENSLKMPEYNGSYTPERLVRMRSPVRIWPAAPLSPGCNRVRGFLLHFFGLHVNSWGRASFPHTKCNAKVNGGSLFRNPPFFAGCFFTVPSFWWLEAKHSLFRTPIGAPEQAKKEFL